MQDEARLHSAGVEDDAVAGTSTLSIGQVSALLDVPAPTIRSWERRHLLFETVRDEHGHRRYTSADVAVLRRMRDQRADGVRLSRAVATATTASPVVLSQQVLAASHRLDDQGISAALDAGLAAHGLSTTVAEVLLPSMRELGAQWARGEGDIAHEHLATAAVLAWLARRGGEAPAPLHQRPIVLTCGPQDQHTIALDAFTVLLRHSRFECLNLGARTPAAALRVAVEQSSAAAVVLVSQLARNRSAAVAALQAVSSTRAVLFYAGAAFRGARSRQGLPGHYLGSSLPDAVHQVATHLQRA
jgi:methanogenic corrinoid protein MtbC1